MKEYIDNCGHLVFNNHRGDRPVARCILAESDGAFLSGKPGHHQISTRR